MAPSEIAVIGAGPHALAVVLHLIEADPGLHGRIRVLDPAGAWLARWRDGFARLDIDTLRSPAVHHPGHDPYGLIEFTAREQHPTSGLKYRQPTFAAFDSYCQQLIEAAGLNGDSGAVQRAQVHDLQATPNQVLLSTSVGEHVAGHVVVATNPHRRQIPDWLAGILPLQTARLKHADDVDLRGADGQLHGQRVAVIGGGLTAAHLAVGASKRGASVQLLARRALSVRDFDVEPSWLGPRNLEPFLAEPSPQRRLQLAREARGGGSIPPWMMQRLATAVDAGTLQINSSGPLAAATRSGDAVLFQCHDGQRVEVDRVWLATGTTPGLSAARFLGRVALDCPAADDLPIPNDGLRLGPWPIHVTGRLATLALGPAAGNLWGARQAALAITRDLTGIDLERRRPHRSAAGA